MFCRPAALPAIFLAGLPAIFLAGLPAILVAGSPPSSLAVVSFKIQH